MNSAYELAQLNIAMMREPLDSPLMREFVANIDRINALAEASAGFVWRLGDAYEPAAGMRPLGDSTLVNMSVWRDIESLSDYVHKSAHVEILRRKREWFERMTEAYVVLWWVPAGHRPSVQEAIERLELLRREGPSPGAFTFARRFEPPDRSTCLQEVAAAIVAVRRDHPVRVAIDGVDGSGKTTLADELVNLILGTGREVIRASVDGFHNPREVRYARGPDSPEGYFHDSFDYTALKRNLLEPLGPAGDGICRTASFDYRVNRPLEMPTQLAARNAVLLFDGVFLLGRELEGWWDLTIWVEAPFEVAIERAVARDARSGGGDPAAVRRKYDLRYVPGQRLYLEQCHPREKAHIVLDNTTLEFPRITCRH